MEKRSQRSGQLLKAGLNSIATIEGKTGPQIDDEIGALVGLAGPSLQRYRSGALPDAALARALAVQCVNRGLLGRHWLEQFLAAARFPPHESRALVAELFPAATPAHQPRPRPNMPPPRYLRFVMRRDAYDATLAGLRSALPLTAIVSLGGMGKTSLARYVAGECLEGRAEPNFVAVVWVSDLGRPGTTNLSTLLEEVARVLDFPGIAELAPAAKRREVEHLLRDQKVLLVLDNAETVTDRAVFDWLAWLPAPSKALLTSRVAPPDGVAACLVELKPLEAPQARELIAEHVQHTSALRRLRAPLDQLMPLAEATGGNPKAIELALGLVQRHPVEAVVADMQSAGVEALFDQLFAHAWGLLDAGVARTLLALTLFPASAADEALAYCADLPSGAFQRAVNRLADLQLIDIERVDVQSPSRYAAHPLVRAFAGARLAERPDEEATLRSRWLAWCVSLAEQVGFCWNDLGKLDLLDADHETVQAALEWAAANERHQAALALAEGVRYYYNVRGLWDERRMVNYPRRAAAACRLDDRSELVLALAQHAEVLSKQDTLVEAAQLLAEAEAAAASAALSTDAAFELGHARGLLAHARGDLAAAEAHWRGLLPFAATLDAQKHVINRRWLATCLLDQGSTEEAATLYRASLADARRANDTRSVTGNTLKLAAIDLGRGELAAAEAALAECHAVAARYNDRRRLAEYHRLTARLREAQGDEAGRLAELEQAADLFIRMGMRREAEAVQRELVQLQLDDQN